MQCLAPPFMPWLQCEQRIWWWRRKNWPYPVFSNTHSIYIRIVSPQHLLSNLHAWLKTSLQAVWAQHHTPHTSFLPQTSQKGINCTKTKEQLRSYCLIYILCKHQCVVSALISNWGRTDALAVSSDGAYTVKKWKNPWKYAMQF